MNIEFLPVELASAASTLNPKTLFQWVHLFTQGENAARDGRVFFLTDTIKVIASSTIYAGSSHLPVDYDHQTEFARENGKPAPAAGWITKLEHRQSGLWALVQWTQKAATMISGKEYRYISPTFHSNKAGTIIRILRAGLTNTPALELTQLATRDDTRNQEDTDMTFQAQVAKALGLDEKTSENTLLTALATSQTQLAAIDGTDVAAVQNLITGYHKERREVQLARVDEKVKKVVTAGLLPPGMKGWMTKLCTNDEETFDEFISTLSPMCRPMFKDGEPDLANLNNRHLATRNDSTDAKIAHQLGISTDDMVTK